MAALRVQVEIARRHIGDHPLAQWGDDHICF
jgi:hypothetical protein